MLTARVYIHSGKRKNASAEGQPDALGFRADGGKQRKQHERLPIRGDEWLPERGGCGPDVSGVPLLRRAGGAVHHARYLPGPEAVCLLRRRSGQRA